MTTPGHPFFVYRARDGLSSGNDDEGAWVLAKSLPQATRYEDLAARERVCWKLEAETKQLLSCRIGNVLTQSYTYDALNRLETAKEMSGAAQTWKQTFTYDPYGNRRFDLAQTQMPSGQAPANPIFNLVNNRFADGQGYAYDAAGSITTAPGGQGYEYDGEGRQVKYNSGAAAYSYDGDGRRVKKVAGSVTTIFVYDAGGKLVAEYGGTASQSSGTSYVTQDHLGSTRVVTAQDGAVKARHDNLPFGEEVYAGVGGRDAAQGYNQQVVKQLYTGHERDAETGLDYMKARYYSSSQGRFTSPDKPFADQRQTSPQSWNLYAYVRNNPCNNTDPSGRCSAPAGLKAGSVGICFEAFIAAPRIGVGGLGHGDGRTFAGNDSSKTARVTVWAIVSTDEKSVSIAKSDQVSPSLIGGGRTDASTVAKTGITDSPPQSLQGTAMTDAKLSNINSKVGEKDFGAGVDVTVSIANGTNGGQQLGKDIQTTGAVMAGTSLTAGTVVAGTGKVVEALSPGGTIDGNMTVRISGSGQVDYVGGAVRGYPSYALYSYTVGSNGTVQTNQIRTVQENNMDDLTKPLRKVP